MKFTHININANDWRKLSLFYQQVFDCVPLVPKRDLHGLWFEKVTGVDNAQVEGQHLAVPGYSDEGPTIEIFTYNIMGRSSSAEINGKGFAHIAFEVDDVERTFEKLLEHGGSSCGDMVKQFYEKLGKVLTIIYAKDPEGNIVEIQHWEDNVD